MGMVHIVDSWYLDCDGMGYMIGKLGKRKTKEGTEDCLRDVTYYSTLKSALEGLSVRLEREVMKNTCGELESIVEAYTASHRALIEAIESAFPNVRVESV